jgi:two-component system nitrogen regulation response regulator NtrX
MDKLKKILIIDDELIIRSAVERILHNELGYAVTVAESGQEGLQYIKEEDFALILLDIKMPDRDGLDVLGELLLSKPHQKVIIISGYYPKEAKEEVQKKGIYAFIEKPFTPFYLLNIVKKALEY